MAFLLLKRKVPAKSRKSGVDEGKGVVQRIYLKVKIISMLKTTEKVVRELRKISKETCLFAMEGKRLTKQFRIFLEEVKEKVGFVSPAALRFIGPGDH